jgi:hypothetical protein
LLFVEEQQGWKPCDYVDQLWTAFRTSGAHKERVHRMTRCVRGKYAGDFHVDVVPYLERGGSHYITNKHDPPGVGCFELSDPEAFTAWINERQRLTNGSFIKVVRLNSSSSARPRVATPPPFRARPEHATPSIGDDKR